MVNLLKNLFIRKKSKSTDMNSTSILTNEIIQKIKYTRQFEILLEEADWEGIPDGQPPMWKPVNMGRNSGKPVIIKADTPQDIKDLQEKYKLADQRFRIIREVNPPSTDELIRMAKEQGLLPNDDKTTVIKPDDSDSRCDVQTIAPVETTPCAAAATPIKSETVVRNPVKYYKVGDIDIKDDNGKIYQRQWMKLTESEASNLRLINDKNNAIVSLVGKHLEMRKWIPVEMSGSDSSTNIEESLR